MRSLCIALCLVSCAGVPPARRPETRSPSGAALCAWHQARTDQLWRAINQGQTTPVDKRDIWPTTCLPTRTGAWAIFHQDLRYEPEVPPKAKPDSVAPVEVEARDDEGIGPSASGRWALGYLLPGGGQVLAAATKDSDFTGAIEGAALGYHNLEIKLLDDYDHDGVVEVLATYSGVGEGWRDQGRGHVMTMKGGAIVPYGDLNDINIDKAEDVDRDGLLDLWTYEPFEKVVDTGNGWRYDRGVPLLLHARRDGSFSRDDATVQDAARKECPSAPVSVYAFRDLACARLYGVPSERLRALVQRACCDDRQENKESLLHMAEADPPFQLAPR